MANNSTTRGYLTPGGTEPLEGAALNDFVQAWLVGVSGLGATMVRPSFPGTPAPVPESGTAWMAFRYSSRTADTFPYVDHDPLDGTDTLQRQEEIKVLCSFYDLGTDGLADHWAGLLRDGLAIPQNLEELQRNGFMLGYVEDMIAVPVLLQGRWQYRVDLGVVIRRQIDRTYAVLNIASEQGTLYNDVGLPPVVLDQS